ncbi:hypothetical protein FS837_011830 [Tulasnella sp. UAMH 9824]|nr:hypothetical protein FS837_011830 [Tulasnella sp. UAMH 9824]
MPPRRASKPSYNKYLVDVNQSSHSETIFINDDTYTRESHATTAPPIIPMVPPRMLPNVPPQPPPAATHPKSVSHEYENSQSPSEQTVIESLEEPAPEDEVDLIGNVSGSGSNAKDAYAEPFRPINQAEALQFYHLASIGHQTKHQAYTAKSFSPQK